ncbi:hypothetical protein MIND_01225800 [Mycena indigotica]|uniref:Uncharacterized protein n=1 Tax=Mycena indigotica TaxID=2126181 RepID=A0A8H6S4Q3_9AGAR|nr:uncharacterized protein MIND_01225800 [Mycena indigotica]KAF7292001.1 hypothetical protein MIND_01225800 [Mycena indigotica]
MSFRATEEERRDVRAEYNDRVFYPRDRGVADAPPAIIVTRPPEDVNPIATQTGGSRILRPSDNQEGEIVLYPRPADLLSALATLEKSVQNLTAILQPEGGSMDGPSSVFEDRTNQSSDAADGGKPAAAVHKTENLPVSRNKTARRHRQVVSKKRHASLPAVMTQGDVAQNHPRAGLRPSEACLPHMEAKQRVALRNILSRQSADRDI